MQFQFFATDDVDNVVRISLRGTNLIGLRLVNLRERDKNGLGRIRQTDFCQILWFPAVRDGGNSDPKHYI